MYRSAASLPDVSAYLDVTEPCHVEVLRDVRSPQRSRQLLQPPSIAVVLHLQRMPRRF